MTPNLRSMKVKILCPTKDWILYQLSHSKKTHKVYSLVYYHLSISKCCFCYTNLLLRSISCDWIQILFCGGSSLISLCWLQPTHYVVIQTALEWCQSIIVISPSKARNIYYSCGMPSNFLCWSRLCDTHQPFEFLLGSARNRPRPCCLGQFFDKKKTLCLSSEVAAWDLQ